MPFSIITPMLEEQKEFIWRGFTRNDIPEVYELLQTVNRVDHQDNPETLADLEQQYDDPVSNPLTDARIIRTLRGKFAAFARVFVASKPAHENIAYVWNEIQPEERGLGLEQETLEWMEQRAAERLAQVANENDAQDVPQVIRSDFPETDTKSIALYRANGYEHVRSFFRMQRDLSEPIPANPLPDGLTLRTYGEDIDEKLFAAFNESFSDHWGHQETMPEEWHPFIIDRGDVRHDLTLVVMDGDEVAAFSINRVRTAENEFLGIRRGWIGTLGTRRAWRKRGIASALLAESMRRFQAEGFDSVGLGVDAENLTGALAIYERIGFKPFKTRVVMEKKVRP